MAPRPRHRARRPLTGRGEAYGWACQAGAAAGLACAAGQDAVEHGRGGWALLFAVLTCAAGPTYFATQWRALRG